MVSGVARIFSGGVNFSMLADEIKERGTFFFESNHNSVPFR